MSYEAIIFDNDGVLTTPNDRAMLRAAAETAFEQAGIETPDEAHVEGLVVNVDPDWFIEICAEYDVEAPDFWPHRDEAACVSQKAAIRDGEKFLYDDVESVLALDQDLAIVSTNQHETIEFILEFFELESHFETYYGREPTVESLRRKKPEPYYLERTMEDLGTDEALYVGDSEHDVIAAANAGIDSAFVRRPHREGYELSVKPTYEIETLEALHGLVADG